MSPLQELDKELADAIDMETEAICERIVSSLEEKELQEMRTRLKQDLTQYNAILKNLKEEPVRKKESSLLLLKAGGQGYRLWKASHDVLASELSSRAPPLADIVASPQISKKRRERRDRFVSFVSFLSRK